MAGHLATLRRRARRNAFRANADINITPMVDVTLVLLIVFMVAAPMMTVAVPVDLPQAKAPNISEQKEPLVITVDGKGAIWLQETRMDVSQLAPRLQAIGGVNPDSRIFVRGDQKINYGRVMEVMGILNNAGYRKVALVAELPQEGARSGAGR